VAIASLPHPDTTAPPSAAERAVATRRSQTLVSICEAEIERLILEGELERGARLNEFVLAARLGVSRGPLREACRSLTQAGLLESRVNRGFFVRQLAHKEVADLYDLRAALMRLAGELVAQRVTDGDLVRLEALVAAMDAAREKRDTARFQDLNAEFHAVLVQAADNRRLQQVYDGLVKELRLFRRRGLASGDAMHASNREHRAIVEAIAARDPASAAGAMANHILQGKARFLSAAAEQLDEPVTQP
jgi:DNA-binding GntR family transcriptional regulator